MSQQPSGSRPSLQGVRIKARKGAVKAQAKHEPAIFRDQLYKHLETVPPNDFEAFANKLVQAGSTLEFLKYADALFEILLVGGLIQPGGSYVEDGAPVSPFTIFNAKEPAEVDDLKQYIEVLNELIRRYKYLQKPLEESALPGLLQYIHRWTPAQKDKLALATGLLISQGLASATCLHALTKDHIVKNDVAVSVITLIFRAYLIEKSMDHLATTLKRGGIKDLLLFFPPNKRDGKILEDHFKKAGLPQVAEWWVKKQSAVVKESVIEYLKEMRELEASTPQIIAAIRVKQQEQPLPDGDLVQCIWQGLMASVDWSARPDQIENLALREVGSFAAILEPFCTGPREEVALINAVQVFCYEDTRLMKSFAQILKILYDKDCITEQAIIYWHSKGTERQGRQHFVKATDQLVKMLKEQEDDSEDEDE